MVSNPAQSRCFAPVVPHIMKSKGRTAKNNLNSTFTTSFRPRTSRSWHYFLQPDGIGHCKWQLKIPLPSLAHHLVPCCRFLHSTICSCFAHALLCCEVELLALQNEDSRRPWLLVCLTSSVSPAPGTGPGAK